ncbi:YceD family protein [uncultured Maribacter sp.]|uniref:YceD family protein n=1 Tax=uncultured Maribacter sp. TaxID=431308 RepID=UPI002614D120|nr:YceD family protein [uncultured Maribacter sp.]
MMKQKEFVIPFSGLKQGKHEYKFVINNEFFESFEYDEFNSANIDLHVILNKTSTMMELDFSASGVVNVNCDTTNEPYNQSVSSVLRLLVKFGEEFNNEDDEILILPHGDHQMNIAQYIYEMLVLAVPQKRVHPGIADGTLKSEALDKLEELQPKEVRENNEENDPRWDELKKLLTGK